MKFTRSKRMKLFGSYVAAWAVVELLLLGTPAHAQSWKPEKPVELIAASGPGGNTDKLARTIQRILQDEKHVLSPINVINKTGGNQTIARMYLNQFPGDGHYMELSNPTLISNNVMGISTQRPDDFSPIVLLLDEYTVFSVRADSPYKTGAELLRRLAEKPDSMSIGLTTRGGANHVALSLAAKAADVDLKRLKVVSFKSTANRSRRYSEGTSISSRLRRPLRFRISSRAERGSSRYRHRSA